MLRESQNLVVARNEPWSGEVASEPYEVGWASEAILWFRTLGVEGDAAGATLRVQLSPDGLRWSDEGTTLPVPREGEQVYARLRHFGAWLRVTATLPPGVTVKPLLTFSLKA
ncbi:hypothetical protein ACE7GA_16970 [Roseomonas sp. CCTCC AB2023176]|uniref:hypothetical protein n=1 Tax=Roseomonas sp. CCTCC AB2023176 TaxID=3342640 RepID=UPI0035DB3503